MEMIAMVAVSLSIGIIGAIIASDKHSKGDDILRVINKYLMKLADESQLVKVGSAHFAERYTAENRTSSKDICFFEGFSLLVIEECNRVLRNAWGDLAKLSRFRMVLEFYKIDPYDDKDVAYYESDKCNEPELFKKQFNARVLY